LSSNILSKRLFSSFSAIVNSGSWELDLSSMIDESCCY
jgi:hypothetical protein